jgi:23S rRNA (guanine745-N1)-methyltransferase
MENKAPSCWRCPVCELPLRLNSTITARLWQCDNQHRFDIAKEGYVNLLQPQHKKSKAPGDSKEMVLARRAFLSQDHYLPLAQHVSEYLLSIFSKNAHTQNHLSVFDAGCGEGYYLSSIADYLLTNTFDNAGQTYSFCGIDIAKPAVQKAAKQAQIGSPDILDFAVANAFNLPVLDDSQHAVIQIFAPSKPDEIHRILKTEGMWINVNPASEHLFELKNMVYDSPQKHIPETDNIEGFTLVSQQTLKFELILADAQQRQNLLMMTPFYWTISRDKKQKLLEELTSTHAHFDITVLRKQ